MEGNKTFHPHHFKNIAHVLLTPLAIPFRLRIWELSLCFVETQGFIYPKSSVTNGAFRVSTYS